MNDCNRAADCGVQLINTLSPLQGEAIPSAVIDGVPKSMTILLSSVLCPVLNFADFLLSLDSIPLGYESLPRFQPSM